MAHVELSLSGAFVPQARTPTDGEYTDDGPYAEVGYGDDADPTDDGREGTDAPYPEPTSFDDQGTELDGIDRWIVTVHRAAEPCLVIDVTGTVLAMSRSCSQLLGVGAPSATLGQPLLGGVLELVDFTAGRGRLAEPEIEKIPPLLALSSERLARGLMRVEPRGRDTDLTVDAISTPLWDGDRVVASLTFLSPVR